MSPDKKKKRKRDKSADPADDLQLAGGSDFHSCDECRHVNTMTVILPVTAGPSAGGEAPAENLVLSWPKTDISTLIETIGKTLPKSDRLKYGTRVKKLDWQLIAFSNHTADECRDKWLVRVTEPAPVTSS